MWPSITIFAIGNPSCLHLHREGCLLLSVKLLLFLFQNLHWWHQHFCGQSNFFIAGVGKVQQVSGIYKHVVKVIWDDYIQNEMKSTVVEFTVYQTNHELAAGKIPICTPRTCNSSHHQSSLRYWALIDVVLVWGL